MPWWESYGNGREDEMKKVAKVVLIVVAVLVLFQVLGLVLLHYIRRVRPHTALSFRIEGEVPEQASNDFLSTLLRGQENTVTDIVQGLDRARTDPHISGVVVRMGETDMNMGKIQEIREALRRFNTSGKFSVAYLEFAGNRTYYLASACRTIFLLAHSSLYVKGMMAGSTFYRGTLDKLGVYPDLLHIGEYKNATNVFTEKKFTPAHKEATEALLDDWFGEFQQGIADSRKLKREQVATLIANGPFTSEEALKAGLVDHVGYSDEVHDFVQKKNQGIPRRIGLQTYLDRTDEMDGPTIAVIFANGDIVSGRSRGTAGGDYLMGSDTIAEQLHNAREDSSVDAVVLRVDSPGGSSFASEVIRREVELTRRAKPMVVSMADVAASGGYWISMSANRIVAEPGTITGSIGVITGKFNLKGLFDKLGISADIVTTTENSTLDYSLQNYTPAQRASVEHQMNDTYQCFVQGVAKGRHMQVADVEKIAQGRVWTGERAFKLGLVDELGGLDTAVNAAKALAKIPENEAVHLEYLPAPRSFLERLLSAADGASLSGRAWEMRAWIQDVKSMASQPVWAILPGVPQVQ
jgi:protease IV